MELSRRFLTSIFLVIIFAIAFYNNFFLSIVLIFIFYQLFYEFFNILKRIYNHNKIKLYIYLVLIIIFLLFLTINIWIIFKNFENPDRIFFLFVITISILSDIGGLVFGKLFKGKKLTRISPNKTYSGAIGSYIFALILGYILFNKYIEFSNLIFLIVIISTVTQLGDLYISFIKRKAKLKDTGSLLPGHGGLLDRFDGIIFGIFFGIIINSLL